MKKYIDAQLQVVRINSKDVIATSLHNSVSSGPTLAPEREFEWYGE